MMLHIYATLYRIYPIVFIVSYHIVLYRIVSYRVVSYCIVSYRIVSYRVVSYRIVLYCIVSYCIVSYCIVSYCIAGEDRWMCTLMMLHGWKLEYTAFCDNTTYCPASFEEFMKQRRRWVLSDMANMLLVFKNIFKLAQKNDSFSIAYILYMLQMFTIVLLSPASTIVIIAGGLDIVYGIPFEIVGPILGCLVLSYALICIVGSVKLQARMTFMLTLLSGLSMLLVVMGGSFYVVEDIMQGKCHQELQSSTVPAFYSRTKCVGSPGMIHDRMPDCHPVS